MKSVAPQSNDVNVDENEIISESDDEFDGSSHYVPPVIARSAKWRRNYFDLTTEDRKDMLADEVFALYLFRMSQRVNATFYKTILAYVILYRECLNEIGWQKKFLTDNTEAEKEQEIKAAMQKKSFCLHNNAELAPEICNDVVTVYISQNEYLYKKIVQISWPDKIDLTINFCHWLFDSRFTTYRMTMI